MDRERTILRDTIQNRALLHVQSLLKVFLVQSHLTFKDLVWEYRHDLYHCCVINNTCSMCPPDPKLPTSRILTWKQLRKLSIIDKSRLFIKDKSTVIPMPLEEMDMDIALAVVHTCDEIFWYFCTEYRNKTLHQLVNEHKMEIKKFFQNPSSVQRSPAHRNQSEWTSCSFYTNQLPHNFVKTDAHISYLSKLCQSRAISWKQLVEDNVFLAKHLLQTFSKLQVHIVKLIKIGKKIGNPSLDFEVMRQIISSFKKIESQLIQHVPCGKEADDTDEKLRRTTMKTESKPENIPKRVLKVTKIYHVLPGISKDSELCNATYVLESRKVIPPRNQDQPRNKTNREALTRGVDPHENEMLTLKNKPIYDNATNRKSFVQQCNATLTMFTSYTGNVLFRTPQARLMSFNSWPYNPKFWPIVLAEAGFFYTGKDNIVQCFSCDFTDSVRNWEGTDTALLVHSRNNPGCDYLISIGIQNLSNKKPEVNTNAVDFKEMEKAAEINSPAQCESENINRKFLSNVNDASLKPIDTPSFEIDSIDIGDNVADSIIRATALSRQVNDCFTEFRHITQESGEGHIMYDDGNVFSPDNLSIDRLNIGKNHYSTAMKNDAWGHGITTDTIDELPRNETANTHEAKLETDAGLGNDDAIVGRLDPDNKAYKPVIERTLDKSHGTVNTEMFDTSLQDDLTVIYRYPEYRTFDSRLYSYMGWSYSAIIKPEVLSTAGYFYTGEADVVRCFCCDLGLAEWNTDDDVWLEHARHSADCWFLVTEKGEDYVRDVQNDWKKIYNPKHPALQNKQSRLNTFLDVWRTDIQQTPEILADAGFFYTGDEDVVRCHYCDGGLRNWEWHDVPWEEHAKWFPFCKYVLKIKGKEYVDTIRRQNETNYVNEEQTASREMTERPKSEVTINDTNVGQFENDPEKLKEVNRQLKEQFLCHRCKTNDSHIVFRPCGHRVVCEECSNKIDRCLICDKKIKSRIKTFLA